MTTFRLPPRRDDTDPDFATTDAGGRGLPCPWCGHYDRDAWELTDGSSDCEACGGARMIERTADPRRRRFVVRARRGLRGPCFDVARAAKIPAAMLVAFLRARGWRQADSQFAPDLFENWSPPNADPAIDRSGCPAEGGFWCRPAMPGSDFRLAIEKLAAHEGPACTLDTILDAILDHAAARDGAAGDSDHG